MAVATPRNYRAMGSVSRFHFGPPPPEGRTKLPVAGQLERLDGRRRLVHDQGGAKESGGVVAFFSRFQTAAVGGALRRFRDRFDCIQIELIGEFWGGTAT